MSFESVAWALEQPVGGTQKILLLGIASHADKFGRNAWPSIDTLAKYAHIEPRTVQRSINDLMAAGYLLREINEGGSRHTAHHMRPNLYHLNIAGKPVPVVDKCDKKAPDPLTPVSPPDPLTPTSPPDTGVTPPPDTRRHDPLTPVSPEQSLEPSIEPSKGEKSACAPTMPDVPPDVLADFLKIRSAKKAPLTNTAIRGIQREADKAGLTLAQAVEVCCELGWQAFNAGWYADRQARKPQGGAGQQAQSFATQDAIRGMLRWEEMTGGTHPDWHTVGGRPNQQKPVEMGLVIDAREPVFERISQ